MNRVADEYVKIIALSDEKCQLEHRLEELNLEIKECSVYWEIDEDGLVQRALEFCNARI